LHRAPATTKDKGFGDLLRSGARTRGQAQVVRPPVAEALVRAKLGAHNSTPTGLPNHRPCTSPFGICRMPASTSSPGSVPVGAPFTRAAPAPWAHPIPPHIYAPALVDHGYRPDEAAKVLGGNAQRVFQQVAAGASSRR